MKKIIARFAVIICLTGFLCLEAIGQHVGSAQEDTIGLDKYQINCFTVTAGTTPNMIINLDNNGQILLACTSERTLEELKSMGIRFTQSQIRLLTDWRLLQENEEVFKTVFPILDEDKTNHLRHQMKKGASTLGQDLREDVISLAKELHSIGREKNVYTILFSYVLDGLVWDIWEEKGILVKRKITEENPFWTGVIWAVYPPRDFACGTNRLSDKGVSLNINWSERAIPIMLPFVKDAAIYYSEDV